MLEVGDGASSRGAIGGQDFYAFFTKITYFQDHIRLNFCLKETQVKCFTVDRNVGISLKYILTDFDLSTPSRFQEIAIQN